MATPDRTTRPDGAISPEQQDWEAVRRREDRATRVAAGLFLVAIVAAFGLLIVYVRGGQTQLEGLLLAIAFGGVGAGLGVWVKQIIGDVEIVEERYPDRSDEEADRAAFSDDLEQSLGEARVDGRRRFLLRLLGGAGA